MDSFALSRSNRTSLDRTCQPAYQGYRITSWSDAEESLMETMKGGKVPTKVESTLAANGAEIITGICQRFGSITADRELLTGANPMAASGLGEKFVQMLADEPVRT